MVYAVDRTDMPFHSLDLEPVNNYLTEALGKDKGSVKKLLCGKQTASSLISNNRPDNRCPKLSELLPARD